MKFLLVALVLLWTPVASLAAEVRFAEQEDLVLVTPDGWTVAADRARNPLFPFATVRVTAGGDRNAICLISILDRNREEMKDPAVLKRLLTIDARPYVQSADELKKLELKSLTLAGGLGFYANFIDPDLVGKPIRKGSYKTATPIVLSLGSDYLIKATILCDDLAGADYAEALRIVESLAVKKLRV